MIHYDPGYPFNPVGAVCGAKIARRPTGIVSEVTCKNCKRWIARENARLERVQAQLNTEKGHPDK